MEIDPRWSTAISSLSIEETAEIIQRIVAEPPARLEHADNWNLVETAHLNGGKEWFGSRYTCVEQPRLGRVDRYYRADRSVKSEWSVDYIEQADLAAAVEALNRPPVLDRNEMDTLAGVSTEWVHRKDLELDLSILYLIRGKGMIEVKDRQYRLTALGVCALMGKLEEIFAARNASN